MTYAVTHYKSYQEYLDDETLAPNGNYRLLETGELIELAEESDLNVRIALRLLILLAQIENGIYAERVRNGNREIQVTPVGDRWVNRKPDLMVLRPEHLKTLKQALFSEIAPPLFVAEVVSPGGENSDNYLRDYVWKRQQYERLGIPEYWIVDPQRKQVTLLALVEGRYESETVYKASDQVVSIVFPTLKISVQSLLEGDS